MKNERIFLSPPHMSGEEFENVKEAFRSNWIAPLGPFVDRFERDFARYTNANHAVSLSSGTAALHLLLQIIGVGRGDLVLCSSFTFIGSVGPILQLGAVPVFIDSDAKTWNLDPNLLEQALKSLDRRGKLPKALVLVHLYGQCADIDPIAELCEKFGVALVEDAAEALGATYKSKHSGTFGVGGIFSFNGNKIMTSGGGGMLVCKDESIAKKAWFLATQAREPAPHYEHKEVGYNYRLSNVLAAIGVGQLAQIEDKVKRRREIFEQYRRSFSGYEGIDFMPEPDYGRASRWLSCVLFDAEKCGASREDIRLALEAENIESRPLWKPMHLQPVFKDCEYFGAGVSDHLFEHGLCLPSGSSLSDEQQEMVVSIVRRSLGR